MTLEWLYSIKPPYPTSLRALPDKMCGYGKFAYIYQSKMNGYGKSMTILPPFSRTEGLDYRLPGLF